MQSPVSWMDLTLVAPAAFFSCRLASTCQTALLCADVICLLSPCSITTSRNRERVCEREQEREEMPFCAPDIEK